MDRFYYLKHSSIDFHFRQTPRDFTVEEVPLYEFSGTGDHLVVFIRKKDLSTHELIAILAKHLGVKNREIGYAGLKDKHALTKQYISIPKSYEQKLDEFEHENIKILAKTYHNNKLKIGHLKGNKFFIRLKKVTPLNAKKIDEAIGSIEKWGMPNYFGYQRFGNDKNNHELGRDIVRGVKKERNKTIKEFLLSAYQSHLFNLWLSRRLEMSRLVESFSIDELEPLLNLDRDTLVMMKNQKHPFKIMMGDLLEHYPYGRLFEFLGEDGDIARIEAKDVAPTGLLAGKRVKRATAMAGVIEKEFDEQVGEDGTRRYAWVYPLDINHKYKEEDAHYELGFYLPKGSYATVLLEEIAKRDLSPMA
ncbi:MAG: tRNA pseudouridine(13) synthase TruD [Sulfurimonas sp.]|jgi:tRNA pseudouridine13 synthase|nr:tRNA pseudouridine(13) synthase TruD [Sulfurimonadaceae bacterium]